jgi:hypothetical protein
MHYFTSNVPEVGSRTAPCANSGHTQAAPDAGAGPQARSCPPAFPVVPSSIPRRSASILRPKIWAIVLNRRDQKTCDTTCDSLTSGELRRNQVDKFGAAAFVGN